MLFFGCKFTKIIQYKGKDMKNYTYRANYHGFTTGVLLPAPRHFALAGSKNKHFFAPSGKENGVASQTGKNVNIAKTFAATQ